MSDAPDLVAHARATRVTVVGGGIAGLVAALECAKVGMPVTLVEASDRLGGCVAAADLDGRSIDVAADRFATSGARVRALVDELELTPAVVAPLPGARWVAGLGGRPGEAAPVPDETVLGIPANPWADDVRRFIGWRGAWRAYLDRLRPPLTIGHERNLGTLVRTRMGDRVLDTMVAPVTRGMFGVEPDDIDVDAAAPGLNAALTRTGSLSGAVAQVLSERRAGNASLERGLHRLVAALQDRLIELGVELRTGFRAGGLRQDENGSWIVSREPDPTDAVPFDATDAAPLAAPDAPVGVARASEDVIVSDILVVAADEAAARRLLDPVVALPAGPAPVSVDVVTLVVTQPALDAGPRGHAVFPVRTRSATAPAAGGVVHATAAWQWLAAERPGTHVLRVTFPSAVVAGLSDADAVALAVHDASALLGVALAPADVRAAHRARHPFAPPWAARGRRELSAAVRAATRRLAGLAVTGAWVSGSGLARVVADTTAETDRVRGAALWGAARASENE